MKYEFVDENGIDCVIEDADTGHENSDTEYKKQNDNKEHYSNNVNKGCGCSGCLGRIISFVLVISGINLLVKEIKKDHIHEYCNLDKIISNHQEDEMESELRKKTYYIYEKREKEYVSIDDYEEIKKSIAFDAQVRLINGPFSIKTEAKKNKLPEGYDFVSDGYAYKNINEDMYEITTIVRVISDKKKLNDFDRVGTYVFTNNDQIFVFTDKFNQDGKAKNIKMVKLDEFDKYIEAGYSFIGVADFNAYDKTLYKAQYSSVFDVQGYNYLDSDLVIDNVYSKTK